MGSLKVTFVQPDGTEKTIDNLDAGQSIMEVGRNAGIEGIAGDCGGGCACATCHVYIDPQWQERVGPANDIEAEMLDMVSDVQRDNSRLSCQIQLSDELNGLKVVVAPAY